MLNLNMLMLEGQEVDVLHPHVLAGLGVQLDVVPVPRHYRDNISAHARIQTAGSHCCTALPGLGDSPGV